MEGFTTECIFLSNYSLLVLYPYSPSPPFPSFSLWRQKSSRNKREPNPISMSLFLALFWLLSGEQKDLNLVAPFFILRRTVEPERGEGWETADAPRVTPHRGEGFHNVKSHFFPSFFTYLCFIALANRLLLPFLQVACFFFNLKL